MSFTGVLGVVVLVALVVFNGVCVALVLLQLPGAWLMLLATGLAAWWGRFETVSPWTLGALAALALAGEAIEFLAGAAGAAKAGGSKRAAMLALVGAMIGALLGLACPPPIVASVLGACLGAAAGSILGDRWAGRSWEQAAEAGKGAAKGRLLGTIGKVAVAGVMWLVVLVAVLV